MEYCIADTIYHRSNNSRTWYSDKSARIISKWLGISLSGFWKAIDNLIEKNIIIKNEKWRLKTTEYWYRSIIAPNTVIVQESDTDLQPSKEPEKGLEESAWFYRQFDHLKISHHEYNELKKKWYSKGQIDSILDQIQNYKQNSKYKSLYLTAKNWLKKETPQGGQSRMSVEEVMKQRQQKQ